MRRGMAIGAADRSPTLARSGAARGLRRLRARRAGTVPRRAAPGGRRGPVSTVAACPSSRPRPTTVRCARPCSPTRSAAAATSPAVGARCSAPRRCAGGSGAGAVGLVPVPVVRRGPRAARGGDHVERLARVLARSRGAAVAPAAAAGPAVRDSAGLTARAAAANLAGAMRAPATAASPAAGRRRRRHRHDRRHPAPRRPGPCAAGWSVLGAAVVAATAAHRRRRASGVRQPHV